MPSDREIKINVSVRHMVEFIHQSGDIITVFGAQKRMEEGRIGHQIRQKSGIPGYKSEVYLTHSIIDNNINLTISGRADGVMERDGVMVVDEIKTTRKSLNSINENDYPVHWSQAICYGWFLLCDNNLETIEVQLTYYNVKIKKERIFIRRFTKDAIKKEFNAMIEQYLTWLRISAGWQDIRNKSIENIKFPYPVMRNGQRKMMAAVYKTIGSAGRLYAEAPTGTGKTMGTVFPALKAVGEGKIEKIFYLTARNTVREIACGAIDDLRKKGLMIKSIIVSAKEKVCPYPGTKCHPDFCKCAKGHFDRVKYGIEAIFPYHHWDADLIGSTAAEYTLCPHEFSLDLSNLADVIICDYNYAFDPRVYLRRFFMQKNNYLLLIDEAHNLVDRARSMYSATLSKRTILDLRREVKTEIPNLFKKLNILNKFYIEAKKKWIADKEKYLVEKEPSEQIEEVLREILEIAEQWLMSDKTAPFREALMDFFFDIWAYLRIYEGYDNHYVTLWQQPSKNDVTLTLFCIDPSVFLDKVQKKVKATVFFSATLSPCRYYMDMLGADEESLAVILPSPFPADNLRVIISGSVATTYRQRDESAEEVVRQIDILVKGKKANYLVFFPSYRYMRNITELYETIMDDETKIIIQQPGMRDDERQAFLAAFNHDEDHSLVAFAVMGGIFGEGIDLVGEKLSGAVIVGVGLPQLCPERDIIKKYFTVENNMGFEYAYVYPGINRVLQAAGRVIRTAEDKGVVMLIDRRFCRNPYRYLLPKHWQNIKVVSNWQEIERNLEYWW